MWQKLILWLEAHQGNCMFREHAGLACPGCGMQRSILALLKGHLWESLLLYPALLPLMAMFGFLAFHLIFNLKHGALILKVLYISNAILIVGNYIIKLTLY
jgi:hypothetical protein